MPRRAMMIAPGTPATEASSPEAYYRQVSPQLLARVRQLWSARGLDLDLAWRAAIRDAAGLPAAGAGAAAARQPAGGHAAPVRSGRDLGALPARRDRLRLALPSRRAGARRCRAISCAGCWPCSAGSPTRSRPSGCWRSRGLPRRRCRSCARSRKTWTWRWCCCCGRRWPASSPNAARRRRPGSSGSATSPAGAHSAPWPSSSTASGSTTPNTAATRAGARRCRCCSGAAVHTSYVGARAEDGRHATPLLRDAAAAGTVRLLADARPGAARRPRARVAAARPRPSRR